MFHKLLYILLLMTAFPVCAQDYDVDSCRHLSAEDFFIGITSCEHPMIIDTRSHEEFSREWIPGAVLAEGITELERIADTLDHDQPIFLYCQNNKRSPVACRILSTKGFRNVYNLIGGIESWKLSSYKVDSKKIRKKL